MIIKVGRNTTLNRRLQPSTARPCRPSPPTVICASIHSGTATMASQTRMIQPATPAIQIT